MALMILEMARSEGLIRHFLCLTPAGRASLVQKYFLYFCRTSFGSNASGNTSLRSISNHTQHLFF